MTSTQRFPLGRICFRACSYRRPSGTSSFCLCLTRAHSAGGSSVASRWRRWAWHHSAVAAPSPPFKKNTPRCWDGSACYLMPPGQQSGGMYVASADGEASLYRLIRRTLAVRVRVPMALGQHGYVVSSSSPYYSFSSSLPSLSFPFSTGTSSTVTTVTRTSGSSSTSVGSTNASNITNVIRATGLGVRR